MQRVTILTVAAIFCSLAAGADVHEQSVADGEANPNVIRLGDAFYGTWSTDGETDTVVLVTDQQQLCDFELYLPAEASGRLLIQQVISGSRAKPVEGQPLRYVGFRINPGRTVMTLQGGMRGGPADYTLVARPCADPKLLDEEPNDAPNIAFELPDPCGVEGVRSRPLRDTDCYRFRPAESGPYHLVLNRRLSAAGSTGHVRLRRGNDTLYHYYLNDMADAFHFYPVLDRADWSMEIHMADESFTGYRLELAPWRPGGPDDLPKGEAREALERALAFLDSQTPATDTPDTRSSYPETAEALVMAALSEGGGYGKMSDRIEQQYVEWLAEQFEPAPDGVRWHDREIHTASRRLYQAAIVTLGLAETADAGSERARTLAASGLRYLLATQQTETKPVVWNGPVAPSSSTVHGGWRYDQEDRTADLSVTGWCWVAIAACEAAGIQEPGMGEALQAGADFAKRCEGQPGGFRYTPTSGGTTHTLQGVGALLFLLDGQEGRQLDDALAVLDHHLPAGTQVDDGGEHAFYYWYYGTRVNYLRGGPAWQRWRRAMMEQLIRRQEPDGRWAAFRGEERPGDRFTTALGAMIMRICLEDVPAYLRHEAKGF